VGLFQIQHAIDEKMALLDKTDDAAEWELRQHEIIALKQKFTTIQNARTKWWAWATVLMTPAWCIIPIYYFLYLYTTAEHLYSTMIVFLSAFCIVTLGSMYLIGRKTVTGGIAKIFIFVELPLSTVSLAIGLIFSFATLYRMLGVLDDKVPSFSPETCLYFSIVTWTTLGYGDVTPTGASRMIAASEALVGYLFMAAFIACFGYILSTIIRRNEAF
jgi:hypothetical protein